MIQITKAFIVPLVAKEKSGNGNQNILKVSYVPNMSGNLTQMLLFKDFSKI